MKRKQGGAKTESSLQTRNDHKDKTRRVFQKLEKRMFQEKKWLMVSNAAEQSNRKLKYTIFERGSDRCLWNGERSKIEVRK